MSVKIEEQPDFGFSEPACGWDEWTAKCPISDALAEAQVFFYGPTEDGRMRFQEECDIYYAAALTSDQVRDLAKELLWAADQLDAMGAKAGG